ncbi:MAG: hypothetical protein RJB11_3442, partial [Planctomycetota bacterium]
MKRKHPELLDAICGRALALGLGVLSSSMILTCLPHNIYAQDSTAASKTATAQAIAAIKAMPGISVQEKDGEVIGVDFRKCGDDWVKTFPRVLEIPTVQTISVSGPAATHDLIVTLKSLPNLKALRMEQAAITDETIAQVAK